MYLVILFAGIAIVESMILIRILKRFQSTIGVTNSDVFHRTGLMTHIRNFQFTLKSIGILNDIENDILCSDCIHDTLSSIKKIIASLVDIDEIKIVYHNTDNNMILLSSKNGEIGEIDNHDVHLDSNFEDPKRHAYALRINNKIVGFAYFFAKENLDVHQRALLDKLETKMVSALFKLVLFKKLLSTITLTLSEVAEEKDPETSRHLTRISKYSHVIAKSLRKNFQYSSILTHGFIDKLVLSAPLHDIGKLGISETILNKPGKLTNHEFDTMKTHTTFGGSIIKKIDQRFKTYGFNDFEYAYNIAMYHQEKFSGNGYPLGLKGKAIPLEARICAVADVFDALTSKRAYKEPFTLDKSLSIMKDGRNEHFDPDVLDPFLSAQNEIEIIYNAFKDQYKDDFH